MRALLQTSLLPLAMLLSLDIHAASGQCPPLLETGAPAPGAITQYHPEIADIKIPIGALTEIQASEDPANDLRRRYEKAQLPSVSPSLPAITGTAKTNPRTETRFAGPVAIGVPGAGLSNAIVEQDGKFIIVGSSDVVVNGNNQQGVFLTRLLANGKPDTSFGQAGFTRIVLFADNHMVNNSSPVVTLSPDGMIVIARSISAMFPGDIAGNKVAMVRLQRDGAADQTFGSSGLTYTSVDNQFGAAAVTIQRDGKIIVAGSSGHDGQCSQDHPCDSLATLMRYQTNGQPDPDFGIKGLVRTKFYVDGDPTAKNSGLNAILLQDDGLILVAGSIELPNGALIAPTKMLVAEYLPTGELNPSFGNGGAVATEFGGPYQEFLSSRLALQEDGMIVTGGTAFYFLENSQSASIASEAIIMTRFTPWGALDTGFGKGGKLLFDSQSFGVTPPMPMHELFGLSLTATGDIYATGIAYDFAAGKTSKGIDIVALDKDGVPKLAFGKAGLYSSSTSVPPDVQPDTGVLTAGDQLLVSGTHWPDVNQPDAFAVWAYSLSPNPATLPCPSNSNPVKR